MLPTIEFWFNYPEIGYLRIEQWLETAWRQYAQGRPIWTNHDHARIHDYEGG